MIRQFVRGKKEKLSKNFYSTEFDCKCEHSDCVVTYVGEDLISSLQAFRDRVGPLVISSGFRCVKHNGLVGGKPQSLHVLGLAVDISSRLIAPKQLAKMACRIEGFSQSGIGVYERHIHCDVGRPKPVRWVG